MILKMTSVSALALAMMISTPSSAQDGGRERLEQAREAVRQARGQEGGQRPERHRPERGEGRQGRGDQPRGERQDRGGERDAFEQARRAAERQSQEQQRDRGRDQAERQRDQLERAQRASERQREQQARDVQAARDSLRDRRDRQEQGRERDRQERDRQERARERWQDARDRQQDRRGDIRDRQQDRREDIRDRLEDQRDRWQDARDRTRDQARDRARDRDRWQQITRERDRERWERQREALERRRDRDRDSWRYVQAWQGRDITYLIRDRNYGYINGCPPGLVWRDNRCLTRGQVRREDRARDWWWSSNYDNDNRWRYYDGYAYREERRDNGLAAVFIPLLAGALGINNVWPQQYAYEPAPTYYRSYYGLEDRYDYRYADGVIYGVDRGGNRIERISALLVGDPWTVGQRMPVGYDVYNVPYDYRDRYRDRDDRWYRYSDGYVYEVDPTTRLVQSVIQLIA